MIRRWRQARIGKRFRDTWKLYRRNKLGMTGLAILSFFMILAAIAPLLTPYDPYKDQGISSALARPSWFTIFNPHVSRDAFLLEDPKLARSDSFKLFRYSAEIVGTDISLTSPNHVDDRVEWSLRKQGKEVGMLSIAYASKTEGGSINISLDRKSVLTNETIQTTLLRPFNYTFAPPPKFRVNFQLTTEIPPETRYRLSVFIVTPEGKNYRLWDNVNKYDSIVLGGAGFSAKNLTAQQFSIDSYSVTPAAKTIIFGDSTVNAARKIFATEGSYKVGMTFAIRDTAETAGSVRFSVTSVQAKIDGDVSGYLGTDELGRDIFTQLIYGTRWALYVGVLAAIIGVVLGVAVGSISGYIGGIVDEVLMRITDFLLVLPFLPFLIVIAILIHPSVNVITWIIALLGWPFIARLIRSVVLSLRSRSFVEAAKASGASTRYILIRHMLPNVSPIAFTQLVLFIPSAIITLTAITFLGLGDATVVDWGYMTSEAFRYGFRNWWWILPPGLLIALLSASFLFVGYAMDEILNPRLRKR